ncbi:hypothetical protein GCM10010353_65790 [Streptomyces chryseus]|nr:hypothetical protein GCM10010353_65790 [Streptomyces chryseus]
MATGRAAAGTRFCKYHAWYRHVPLAMAAHAYLATVGADELKRVGPEPGEQRLEKRAVAFACSCASFTLMPYSGGRPYGCAPNM